MSSDAQIRASVAHNKKMGSITIRPPKEVDSQIRAAAKQAGESLFHPRSKTPAEQGESSGTGVGEVPLVASMVILELIGGLAFSCAWK